MRNSLGAFVLTPLIACAMPSQEQIAFGTLDNISVAAKACDLSPEATSVVKEKTDTTARVSRVLHSKESYETQNDPTSAWTAQERCLSAKLAEFTHQASMAGDCTVSPSYGIAGPEVFDNTVDRFNLTVSVDCADGNIAQARAEQ